MQVPQLPQENTHLLLATRSSLIGKNLGFAWVPERTSWKFSEEISLGTQRGRNGLADLRNRKPGWRRCRRLWTSNDRGVPQGCASARALKPNGLQQSCWLDAWACEGGHADTPPILLASSDGVSMAYLSRTCLVPPMWIAIHMGCTRQVRDRYEIGTRGIYHSSAVAAGS